MNLLNQTSRLLWTTPPWPEKLSDDLAFYCDFITEFNLKNILISLLVLWSLKYAYWCIDINWLWRRFRSNLPTNRCRESVTFIKSYYRADALAEPVSCKARHGIHLFGSTWLVGIRDYDTLTSCPSLNLAPRHLNYSSLTPKARW